MPTSSPLPHSCGRGVRGEGDGRRPRGAGIFQLCLTPQLGCKFVQERLQVVKSRVTEVPVSCLDASPTFRLGLGFVAMYACTLALT